MSEDESYYYCTIPSLSSQFYVYSKSGALGGKGYAGILSRLLELALDDPDMVRKCL